MDAITNEFEIERSRRYRARSTSTSTSPSEETLRLGCRLEKPTAKQLERAEIELNPPARPPIRCAAIRSLWSASVAQVPREVVLELRHSQLTEAFDFFRTARAFPQGWRDLIADLTRFWGWGPHDAWGLTGTQLIWWAEQSKPHR